jgi:hypothetical protein
MEMGCARFEPVALEQWRNLLCSAMVEEGTVG